MKIFQILHTHSSWVFALFTLEHDHCDYKIAIHTNYTAFSITYSATNSAIVQKIESKIDYLE